MAGLRERQKAARRGAIVQAAADLVRERGGDALHLPDVAARAGVSTATVYNLVGGTNAVVAAVVERIADVVDASGPRHAELPPLARCLATVRTSFDVFAARQAEALPALLLYLHRRLDRDWKNERPFARLAERTVDRFRSMVAEAQEHGAFDRSLDAEVVAETLFAVFKSRLEGWATGLLDAPDAARLAEREAAVVLLSGASGRAREEVAARLALASRPGSGAADARPV